MYAPAVCGQCRKILKWIHTRSETEGNSRSVVKRFGAIEGTDER